MIMRAHQSFVTCIRADGIGDPLPPVFLTLTQLLVAILVNEDVKPRARGRHAHVRDAAVPVGFDVGEAGGG